MEKERSSELARLSTNRSARRFRVALFDMDGILYNSMPNHARSWHEAMASYGIEMSLEEAYLYEGMRGVETIKLVARRQWGRDVPDEEAAEMYRHKTEYFTKYAQNNIPALIPGVKELQEAMVNSGLKIGVVTGSGQASLLERIKNDFKNLVTPEIFVTALNIKHGKPAPDPYLKGIEMASNFLKETLLPEQTIVVENAPLGVQSGKAAGCFTIAVNTGPLSDEKLLEAGADRLFHNMEEFKKYMF